VWELQFYVVAVNVKDKVMCLLCNSMIVTVKKYNSYQHYTIHKKHKYAWWKRRLETKAHKKIKLQNQQLRQVYQTVSKQDANCAEATATYRMVYSRGKKDKLLYIVMLKS